MSAIGINWNLKYREQIKTLKDSRAMVHYYNKQSA
jgi:hypothetical protein